MGFRTLAIQQCSSEVWQTLGAVKTEFAKFGVSLNKVLKKLRSTTSEIDAVNVRARVMAEKLDRVEALPDDLAISVLKLSDTDPLCSA
jgi:DNA recombination protein RmuC